MVRKKITTEAPYYEPGITVWNKNEKIMIRKPFDFFYTNIIERVIRKATN